MMTAGGAGREVCGIRGSKGLRLVALTGLNGLGFVQPAWAHDALGSGGGGLLESLGPLVFVFLCLAAWVTWIALRRR